MVTASQILKKYEDQNEYHFYEVDRVWIIEAIKEYHLLKTLESKTAIKNLKENFKR